MPSNSRKITYPWHRNELSQECSEFLAWLYLINLSVTGKSREWPAFSGRGVGSGGPWTLTPVLPYISPPHWAIKCCPAVPSTYFSSNGLSSTYTGAAISHLYCHGHLGHDGSPDWITSCPDWSQHTQRH